MSQERAIVKILCDQLHIEYVESRNMKLDEAAVYTINETVAKNTALIPIGFDKDNPNMMRVAMSDPMDFMAIDDIAIITNFKIIPVLSTSVDCLSNRPVFWTPVGDRGCGSI